MDPLGSLSSIGRAVGGPKPAESGPSSPGGSFASTFAQQTVPPSDRSALPSPDPSAAAGVDRMKLPGAMSALRDEPWHPTQPDQSPTAESPDSTLIVPVMVPALVGGLIAALVPPPSPPVVPAGGNESHVGAGGHSGPSVEGVGQEGPSRGWIYAEGAGPTGSPMAVLMTVLAAHDRGLAASVAARLASPPSDPVTGLPSSSDVAKGGSAGAPVPAALMGSDMAAPLASGIEDLLTGAGMKGAVILEEREPEKSPGPLAGRGVSPGEAGLSPMGGAERASPETSGSHGDSRGASDSSHERTDATSLVLEVRGGAGPEAGGRVLPASPGSVPTSGPTGAGGISDWPPAPVQTLQIYLDPPELGRIRIAVTMVDQQVVAQVSAERPAVYDALQRAAQDVTAALRGQGVDFGGLQLSSSGFGARQFDPGSWGPRIGRDDHAGRIMATQVLQEAGGSRARRLHDGVLSIHA